MHVVGHLPSHCSYFLNLGGFFVDRCCGAFAGFIDHLRGQRLGHRPTVRRTANTEAASDGQIHQAGGSNVHFQVQIEEALHSTQESEARRAASARENQLLPPKGVWDRALCLQLEHQLRI